MKVQALDRKAGEIITFYSYKGGTGRTMALANVACLLAEGLTQSQRILVVDWDLEAPGLHRFLPPRLGAATQEEDLGLDAGSGLVDLFGEIATKLPSTPAESEEAADAAVETALSSIDLESFVATTAVPGVSIMRAGRNDDDQYSRRVGTFDWEGLFRRAPPVYRAVADRLGEMFRYVLIDSRTGVTDISSICTSLMPEKLVVVFTPNRQSLTGVRSLVERATSDRRNSDDLRPLLVYPLPARIEASLQDLRGIWRSGSRDHNIPGYQPMFEELFKTCYGLDRCDMSAYFDEVQIQQTPDYAYGEEIAVRRTTDRFSLAKSYRVFVDRLVADAPPWAQTEGASRYESGKQPHIAAKAPDEPITGQFPVLRPSAPPASPTVTVKGHVPGRAKGVRIFLSYARQDRAQAERIARQLESEGFKVWWDVAIPAGARLDNAVAEALDHSDVVVVCWSKASIASEMVLAEANEGLRRGILIPLLLEDVSPPLAFRTIQSADLRRDLEGGMRDLVEVLRRFTPRSPGTPILAPTSSRPVGASPRSSRPLGLVFGGVGVLVFGAVLWSLLLTRSQPMPPLLPATTTSTQSGAPPSTVLSASTQVPNFVGSQTADVRKVADILDLQVIFRDGRGVESSDLVGIVVAQTPAAGQELKRGMSVRLSVAAATAVVPTVVGMTLDTAVVALTRNQLRLATRDSRPVTDVKPGTIIDQTPGAGTRVAAGSLVTVTVATQGRSSGSRPAPSRPPN